MFFFSTLVSVKGGAQTRGTALNKGDSLRRGRARASHPAAKPLRTSRSSRYSENLAQKTRNQTFASQITPNDQQIVQRSWPVSFSYISVICLICGSFKSALLRRADDLSFRRPEITGAQAAGIQHNLVQHHAGVDHVDSQDVCTRGGPQPRRNLRRRVQDVLRPLLGSDLHSLRRGDNLRRLTVERDGEAQTPRRGARDASAGGNRSARTRRPQKRCRRYSSAGDSRWIRPGSTLGTFVGKTPTESPVRPRPGIDCHAARLRVALRGEVLGFD